jgi:hypothetical protein
MRFIIRFSLKETYRSRLPSILRKILLDRGLENSGEGTFEGDFTYAQIHDALNHFWHTVDTWNEDEAYLQHFWMYADQKAELPSPELE